MTQLEQLPADIRAKIRVDDECWLWIGNANAQGFPTLSRGKNICVSARRFMFEVLNGKPPPTRMVVRVSCTEPTCVCHLVAMTRQAQARLIRPASGPVHAAKVAAAKQQQSNVDWAIVRELRQRHAAGEFQADLAAELKLSKHQVYKIVNYLCWREVPTSGVAQIAHFAGMLA